MDCEEDRGSEKDSRPRSTLNVYLKSNAVVQHNLFTDCFINPLFGFAIDPTLNPARDTELPITKLTTQVE
jgi:hypothetical protein